MNTTTSTKTRLEDWVDRRQHLLTLALADPRNIVQLRLLDYLIGRYRDSPEAHQPARFRFERELHWNDRRITVHHHLGRGKVAGVQNSEDAQQRMATLLQRMKSDERQEDENFELVSVSSLPRLPIVHHHMDWRIKLGWNADLHMRAALASYPILSQTCLQHLATRLSDVSREDRRALDLFQRCQNRNILDQAARIWRDRVAQGCSTGWITESLEAQLGFPKNQPRAAELIRERLADDNAQVRIAASHLIATLGDLDDIGLLSDLLALPPSDDEDPHERDAIIAAMSAIAERAASSSKMR